MGTLSQNIMQAIADFNNIKEAISEKINVPAHTATNEYAGLIRKLKTDNVYGVSGLYQSNTALTRTDDAVEMSFVINSSSGTISSDFNSVFPWNEAEVVDDVAGKFVKFPRMFFRIGVDTQHRITDIAVSKTPSGEGDWYKVEPFLYSCYGGSVSDDKLQSLSGVNRKGAANRAQFRNFATANGTEYCLLDLYHRTVLMFLWLIEFATKKSDSIMTGRISRSGTSGASTIRPTGGTDSLSTPSGYETDYNQMRYHYIEDFIGNQWEFVDGIYCKNTGENDYVTNDPAKFSDSTANKNPLIYSSPAPGWVAALGWDENNPFLCMPVETNENGSDTTYFCDYSEGNSPNNVVLCCGANYSNSSTNHGLTYFNRSTVGYNYASRGSRLIKII